MLALRAHVLAPGHSGVRRDVVLRFVEMLERDIVPVVPEQGSLGAWVISRRSHISPFP